MDTISTVADIIGYKKFSVNKNGQTKDYCIISVLEPFSDFEVQNGARGYKAHDVFVPKELQNLVNDGLINADQVEFVWQVNSGKMYLKNIIIKK